MTSLNNPVAPTEKPHGAAHWRAQRFTAVALVPLGIWFLVEILRHTWADYPTVLAWASQPWIGTGLALFVGVAFYHGTLGLQVVIEDYVPNFFWQKTLVFLVRVVNLAMAILAWFFILHIAISGHIPLSDNSGGILGSRRGGIFDLVLTPRVGSLEGKIGDEKTVSDQQPKTSGIIGKGYNRSL